MAASKKSHYFHLLLVSNHWTIKRKIRCVFIDKNRSMLFSIHLWQIYVQIDICQAFYWFLLMFFSTNQWYRKVLFTVPVEISLSISLYLFYHPFLLDFVPQAIVLSFQRSHAEGKFRVWWYWNKREKKYLESLSTQDKFLTFERWAWLRFHFFLSVNPTEESLRKNDEKKGKKIKTTPGHCFNFTKPRKKSHPNFEFVILSTLVFSFTFEYWSFVNFDKVPLSNNHYNVYRVFH